MSGSNGGPAMTPASALALGWSIFPIGPDKKPIITTWKPFQTRRPTEQQLSTWIAWQPAGWALVTGALSGLITLDFDGEAGCQLLKKLKLDPHRSTPRGGYHVDFVHPGWYVQTLNSKAKKALGERYPGLDIKGDGGYVAFTGHMKYDTVKGDYTWLRDPAPYSLDILPVELREFLGLFRAPAAANGNGNGQVHEPPPKGRRVDPEKLIRKALDRVSGEGRNNAGFWLAVQFRDNGYSFSEADSLMHIYQNRCPDTNTKGEREAYSEQEVQASLREAYKQPPREPWAAGGEQQPRPETGTGQEAPAAPAAMVTAIDGSDEWRYILIRSEKGNIVPCVANAITALRHSPTWRGVFGFDEFANRTVTLKPTPWKSEPHVWNDTGDILVAEWMQHEGIGATREIVAQAIEAVCRERCFHPIRQYLNGLRWDGKPRLGRWLQTYAGVIPDDDTKDTYISAVGSRWLISAVARVMRPGCKADCAPIFEGPQGKLKSTLLRVIGGEWFTDEIAELGSKDAAMQCHGAWIIELAELDAMSRAETSKVKAFMSRTRDRFRPPYGRRLVDLPRQCVFAGTVNVDTYLKDDTGNRRWWPIRCMGVIDIDALARDRDQLWAEAVVGFDDGDPWWFETEELVREAEAEQAARYAPDAWDSIILDWAGNRITSGYDSVSVAEVLRLCLNKEPKDWTRADEMRVSSALKSAKWERFQQRVEGIREWRYRKVGDKWGW